MKRKYRQTISAGIACSHALKADGTLTSWGSDSNKLVSHTPSGSDFLAVASGYRHSLALKSDGSLVSWGYDAYGQVSHTPSGSDFVAIADGGYRHSHALKADGSLVSWGYDEYGQVSNTPSNSNFVAIAGGTYHSLALKKDGSLVSWGDDDYGQVSKKTSDRIQIPNINIKDIITSEKQIKQQTAGLERYFDYELFDSEKAYQTWYKEEYQETLKSIGLETTEDAPTPLILPDNRILFTY